MLWTIRNQRQVGENLPQPQGKARLRICFRRNRRWTDWATLSEGCYLLRTNLTDTDPATLWKRYIQLTEPTSAAAVRPMASLLVDRRLSSFLLTSKFSRILRHGYLEPDITQALLWGRFT